uniref:Uncharacterized protein n=1 Tax=Lactuca sativa TaxID=4236 RepID=A0A9R1V3Z0_LACSA|nr:hypothetical protein LSAT_V11C600328070 [Lactuca sativa]
MADQIEQLGIKIKTQQKDFEELQTQFNVQVEECSNLSNKLESTHIYSNYAAREDKLNAAFENIVRLHKASANGSLEDILAMDSSNAHFVEELKNLHKDNLYLMSFKEHYQPNNKRFHFLLESFKRDLIQASTIQKIYEFINGIFDKLMEESKEIGTRSLTVLRMKTNMYVRLHLELDTYWRSIMLQRCLYFVKALLEGGSDDEGVSTEARESLGFPLILDLELHFEDDVLGLEDNGYLIWEAITLGAFVHTGTRRVIKTQTDYSKLLLELKDVPQDEKDKLINNVKAMRIIQFALSADTFRLVSSCDTAKAIWDRLKELYSTDADFEHSTQTLLLSEFGSFA